MPASIKSNLVKTPNVRNPRGSTERASLRESEFARSTFAGETARITLPIRFILHISEIEIDIRIGL